MQTTQRVEIIDILRGWSLFVVIISNYLYFGYSPEGEINGSVSVSAFIEGVEKYLFVAKGWTLLFVLFGFGFGVVYAKKQHKAYSFLSRRMLVLLVFALLNSFIFDGDILRDYAVLGLLSLLFIQLSARKLLYISGVMLLLLPFLTAFINSVDGSYITTLANKISPLKFSNNWLDVFQYNFQSSYYYEVLSLPYSVTAHYVMFICMILGLTLQKSAFVTYLLANKSLLKKIMTISFLLNVLLWTLFTITKVQKWTYIKYFSLYYWIVLATVVCTVSIIMFLYSKSKEQVVFKLLSNVGKMTFTNYLVQNIITLFVFQGVGLQLYHHMPFYFYLLFAIIVYMLQVAFSYWWLQSYTYGPFEWLWRQLSKTKKHSGQTVISSSFSETN